MSVDGSDNWSEMKFIDLNTIIRKKISCVYFLMNDDELVYIGQTKNLRHRLNNHKCNLRYNIKVGDKEYGDDFFNSVFYLPVEDDKQKRIELEDYYIANYQPKLNSHYDMGLKMFNPDAQNEWMYDIKIKIPSNAEQVMDDSWFD